MDLQTIPNLLYKLIEINLKLIFRFDKTSKNYEKIAELLNSEKVQEDLKK